ncbi:ras guanine nucleotide exchange factor i-related [Anaeramoeba ignava]|uniref:Ras guanine nucleotide exchange factor i-related n=1 Tax=Anaeramoeba ignava TaxID=1746090 RepID=A0A9Q0RG84_ANAIG|nr:ras guanine nucleotide exchange factor i-related [Anaeramoeba ignava]
MDQLKNLKKKRSFRRNSPSVPRASTPKTSLKTSSPLEEEKKSEEEIKQKPQEEEIKQKPEEEIKQKQQEEEIKQKQEEEEKERIKKQKQEEEEKLEEIKKKQEEEEKERIKKQKEKEEEEERLIKQKQEEKERIKKQKEKEEEEKEKERIRIQKEEEEKIKRKKQEEEKKRKQEELKKLMLKDKQENDSKQTSKDALSHLAKPLPKEKAKKAKKMNFDEHPELVLTSNNQLDRSEWLTYVLKRNPQIKDLRERITPLNRAQNFAKIYKAGLPDVLDQLTEETILQLIMQHLVCLGSNKTKETLEKETGVKYEPKYLTDSRLHTLLRMAIRETEKVWDIVLDQRSTDGDAENDDYISELDEHLIGLGFEAEDEDAKEDVYIWKEPNDSESNLLLTEQNEIKAANLNKLVEKLTSQPNYGVTIDTFLMTYQSFTSPKKLLAKLIQRYHVPKSPNENEDEYLKRKKVIQIKVINVCTKWIEKHFSDFSNRLIRELYEFIDETLSQDDKNIAKKLRDTVVKRQKGIDKKTIIHESENIPEPKVPKNIFSTSLSLLDVEEEEVARQLTLIEFDLFSQIKPSELLNQSWSKPKFKHRAKNLLAMIERFNDVSGWVATTIINCEKIKHRTRVFTRFFKILEYCRQLNNFNAVMALLAGFNSSAIYRLKFTWAEIPKRQIEVFEQLEKEMSSDSSYKGYRDALKGVNPPCIPYLGVHLTDLTFIEDGNPDFIGDLINFSKRIQISKVIRNIQQYQQKGYELQPVQQIQSLLTKFKNLSESEIYPKSLTIEPRDASIENIQ